MVFLLAGLTAGCAGLDDRPSLGSSVVPEPTRGYLYGRFQLKPGSMTQGGRLLLQLTNMGTGESLTIHFRNTPQEMYLTDVVPGEYEFTQLLYAPVPTTEGNIRRDNLRVPPEMSFMGQPFSVEAGKAYYVGEWFGAVDRDVDFYVVVSRIRTKWGLYQLRYDYEEATTAMKRLYPTLDLIEARPAWRR